MLRHLLITNNSKRAFSRKGSFQTKFAANNIAIPEWYCTSLLNVSLTTSSNLFLKERLDCHAHENPNSSQMAIVAMSKTNSSAPSKTKLDSSPTWDQLHPPCRCNLTDPDVYYAVAGLTTQLGISSISTVAAQLLDFALQMSDQGQIGWAARPDPIPDHLRQELTWEKTNIWTQEIKPDRERKQRKLKVLTRQQPSFGFRWGKERHTQVKFLAGKHGCTLGKMVTQLLAFALDEYRAGHVKLVFQPVDSGDVLDESSS